MILAGDIGGTKTVLALLQKNSNGGLDCVQEQTFPSQDFASFDEVLTAFLTPGATVSSACFGIAGAIVNQRCHTTNLPWVVDGAELQTKLGTAKVKLLNDLEAMALGMLHIPGQDLLELNPAAESQTANIAVIAAGTGLGEAILYWDGSKHQPMATEGGHADFAPQTPQQVLLLDFLSQRYPGHVSWERLVSGMGFGNIYDFLLTQQPATANAAQIASAADRNAMISELGLSGQDALCAEVVQLFVQLYGAEAGNLALKSLAIGGVFIGGGIAPKILPAIQNGGFMQAFTAKGRFADLLGRVSVKVCLNPRTPLIGAMHYFG